MKTKILLRFAFFVACVGFVVACNKNNANNPGSSTSTSANLATQADDQTIVSNETDAVVNDANTTLNSQVSFAGSNSSNDASSSGVTTMGNTEVNGNGGNVLGNLICDATVTVDTSAGQRIITITYNGSNCRGNRIRTGVVVITIPVGVYWKNAGAVVSIDIQNLKITRVTDNKSIVINGTKKVTNVSGGLLINLASLGTITHTITGQLTITFDGGSQRDWSVSKQRVFTYDNGIVITTTGTHTDSLSNTDVAEWGTNRFGTGFESLISQPKVIRQDCDFRLVSGENVVLRTDDVTTTITYGLDANGNPTSCPGTGTYYFKVVRTNANGISFTKIMPY